MDILLGNLTVSRDIVVCVPKEDGPPYIGTYGKDAPYIFRSGPSMYP